MKEKLLFDLCMERKNLHYVCFDTGQAPTFNSAFKKILNSIHDKLEKNNNSYMNKWRCCDEKKLLFDLWMERKNLHYVRFDTGQAPTLNSII